MVAGLAAFSAAALAAGLGRAVMTTYLPVALDRIRDAPALIGLVMLVNVAAGFAVPLWVGMWSDRVRERGHGRTVPFILGGAAVASLGMLLTAAVAGTAYLALAATALVAYTGLNAITTAHRALIAESYPPDERAPATGAEELALLLGTTLGVAAGGALVEWRIWAPFALAGVVVPLLAIPTVLRMRGRERTPAAHAPHPAVPLRYLARVASRPGVARVLVAQGLWVLGYAALPAFFVLYAEDVLGLTPSAAGGLLVLFGAVCGASMLLAGLERRPERHAPLLCVGVALMGGGLLAMTPAEAVPTAMPGLLAAAVGFGMLSTLGFPLMTQYIPDGEAGAYTAVYFSMRSIAGAVALPAAGGLIAATGSYRALVAFGGAVALLALIPLAPLALRAAGGPPRPPALPTPAAVARRLGPLVLAVAAALALGPAVHHTPARDLDEWLFARINEHGPGPEWLDGVLVGPDFRNYVLLALLTGVAAARWRRRQAVAVMTSLALAALLSWGLVRLIWAVWERPRPQEVLAGVQIGAHDFSSYGSYPSGHVAVWLAMSLVVAAVFPRARWALVAVVALVALTRVLGGAHFPADLLGACLLGWAAAWALEPLYRGARPGPRPPRQPKDARRTRAESRRGRKALTSSP